MVTDKATSARHDPPAPSYLLAEEDRHLWRIRGSYFDLGPFLDTHPGGREFLELTRGTDITHAFESHHVRFEIPERVLARYFVRGPEGGPAGGVEPRRGTFSLDLRIEARAALAERGYRPGPHPVTIALTVANFLAWLALAHTASRWHGLPWLLASVVCGFLLLGMGAAGHGFVHQGSRLSFVFDMVDASTRTWRIDHCLLHHMFTNDHTDDPDVTVLGPAIDFSGGGRVQRRLAWLYCHLLYLLGAWLIRVVNLFRLFRAPAGLAGLHAARIVMPAFGAVIFYALTAWWRWLFFLVTGAPLGTCILSELVYSLATLSCSFVSHNQPACDYAGSFADRVAAAGGDWDLAQLRECWDFGPRSFWAATYLGGHLGNQTVHHLFPAVDPWHHRSLIEVLERVCARHQIAYRRHSWLSLWRGHMKSMMRPVDRRMWSNPR